MAINDNISSTWQKFLAAVKSAPMTFVYGLVIGAVAGALLW